MHPKMLPYLRSIIEKSLGIRTFRLCNETDRETPDRFEFRDTITNDHTHFTNFLYFHYFTRSFPLFIVH